MTQASEPASSSSSTNNAADRELAITRVFDAPRELVWKMFTDVNHLAQWWGPVGFTTTTHSFDFKPGGGWRLVMHGPDGRDYENRITYLEIVEPSQIVYKHGGDVDKTVEPVNFTTTVTFDDAGNGKTRMHWRMVFPSAATKQFVIDNYGADTGLVETIGRLEQHLAAKPFVIARTFDAPRQVVWDAWTQREQLVQWFGPKGFTISHAEMDLRVGGSFLYSMRNQSGFEMWGKWLFREVDPPSRIVHVHSFSNPAGEVTRPPFANNWPLRMLATTTFVEHKGKTTVTITSSAMDASPEEAKTFDSSHDSMRGGWTGTFEQLDAYLAARKG